MLFEFAVVSFVFPGQQKNLHNLIILPHFNDFSKEQQNSTHQIEPLKKPTTETKAHQTDEFWSMGIGEKLPTQDSGHEIC